MKNLLYITFSFCLNICWCVFICFCTVLIGVFVVVCFALFLRLFICFGYVFFCHLLFVVVSFDTILVIGLSLGLAVVLVIVLVIFFSFHLIFCPVAGNAHRWLWPSTTAKTRFMRGLCVKEDACGVCMLMVHYFLSLYFFLYCSRFFLRVFCCIFCGFSCRISCLSVCLPDYHNNCCVCV